MSINIVHAMKAASFALALCTGSYSFAADPVTDAMQEAYAPYRVALFKTNSNSQAESRQAVSQAQQAWNKLTAQFGTRPPAPYDRDAAFAASLEEVAKVYVKAAEEIGANKLGAAHETLEQARDVMADLRRRNQVIVYSDHMNAYHAEMEHVLINGSKILSQPDGLLQLTAAVGTLNHLAKALTSQAPAEYSKNDGFVSALKAVDKSVGDLQRALFAQDAAAVKDAMGKLKMPYSKLFLKFG